MGEFSAVVGAWANGVLNALEIIFKESVQELIAQMQALVPVDTGFLRSSLMASTAAMPMMTRANPGVALPDGLGEIMLVIASADVEDTIFLGYTANYAAFVHYGAGGREPRQWVTLVAQRWPEIVAAKAADVKARLGL